MQNLLIRFFYKIGTSHNKKVWLLLTLAVLFLLIRSTTLFARAYYDVKETDESRGALVIPSDSFGDKFDAVKYLDQGWKPADSMWYYTTTQGSDLLPYDFFLLLEQEKSSELFRSPENINHFRYLPQKATPSNPDGLPVGMMADVFLGKKYMGFNCAACHTSQVNYQGLGIRIDGGPGAADMDSFMRALEAALSATVQNADKQQRFVDKVLKAGSYSDKAAVLKDLDTYKLRLQAYNFFNKSTLDGNPVPYGYARLDAFGRIFNRVEEHLLDVASLRAALDKVLPPEQVTAITDKLTRVLSGTDRDHVMTQLIEKLTLPERRILRDSIFHSPNAPASYPFLWDIPQSDYVQWNGIGVNAGVGPIGRNAGEVIGVFATLDWSQKKDWTVSSVLGGQGFGKTHISFKSSVDVHNLRGLEDRLGSLQSPQWTDPKAGLPAIDKNLSAQGEILYAKHCASCHAVMTDRTSPDRRVVAHMDKLEAVGTDPRMATNAVTNTGYSGVLLNMYSTTPSGNILLNTKAPMAALLTTATQNVVATPDPDRWPLTRGADWATDLIKGFFSNKIKPSLKQGDYNPDTTVAPYASLGFLQSATLKWNLGDSSLSAQRFRADAVRLAVASGTARWRWVRHGLSPNEIHGGFPRTRRGQSRLQTWDR